MKLQLLYVFVLAAPLLVRLLSPEPATPPPPAESTETAPARIETTALPAKTETAPASTPAQKQPCKRASVRRIPANHAYTLM